LNPGSHQVAREKVAEAGLRLGVSLLGVHCLSTIASRGDVDFRTYPSIARAIEEETGWLPHVESVGRKIRELATRFGAVSIERVKPGELPKRAKYRSAYGTTNKSINWRALGARNPTPRGAARKARRADEAVLRQQGSAPPSLPPLVGSPRAGQPERGAPLPPRLPLRERQQLAREALERWEREFGDGGTGPAPVPPEPQTLNTGPPE